MRMYVICTYLVNYINHSNEPPKVIEDLPLTVRQFIQKINDLKKARNL